jgi:hypothetical protein
MMSPMQSSKNGSDIAPNIKYWVRSAPPMPMFAKLNAQIGTHTNPHKPTANRISANPMRSSFSTGPRLETKQTYSVFCCGSADTDCISDLTQRSAGVASAAWLRASI